MDRGQDSGGPSLLRDLLSGATKPKRVTKYPKRDAMRGMLTCRLDRNDRARLLWWAECKSRKMRKPRQHKAGPLTRAFKDVLRALLRLYHGKLGSCAPAAETIAEEAGVDRSTVFRALPVIEALGVMTYARRLLRETRQVRPGFWSRLASNTYSFTLPAGLVRLASQERAIQSQSATDPFKVTLKKPQRASAAGLEAALAKFEMAVARRNSPA